MSKESTLFKEAFADAKAVRATALANAKFALEEAFTPRFQAMFAEKLKEETGELDNMNPTQLGDDAVNEQDIDELIRELESEVEDNPMGDDSLSSDNDPMAQDDGMGDVDGLDAATAPEDGAVGIGDPIPAGVPVVIQPANQAGAVPAAPAEVPDVSGAGDIPDMAGGEFGDDDDDDVDLNELLESLKEEAESDEDEECLEEGVPVNSSGIGGDKAGGSDNKKPSTDASTSSKIENAAKDRVGGGEGYKSGPADPTEASRPNSKGEFENTPKLANEEVETGIPDGTITADEPSEADRPNKGDNATKTNLSTPSLSEYKALQTENAKLKKQCNEAVAAVRNIKGQLNEINLLNAKLLYTNKLFKEFNMPNDRKMRVVEMFDLASNVREAKLTYATIANSLSFGGGSSKKSASKATQSITEGMASRPVGSTKPNSEKIISESAMVSKFQKLAGIKKK